MIILNTDLDNTIIYSYKHDIGPEKRNVEIYQEREISFITERTYSLLQAVKESMLIVPTSTRTIEQYKRINLGIGQFKYALVCNGGVLLINGEKDNAWYQQSLKLIEPGQIEMSKAFKILNQDLRRTFELRYIENLFIFTKCNDSKMVVKDLKEQVDIGLVQVFSNGEKVYVVPSQLNKGAAIQRLRRMLKPDYIIAAGDSEFDISMVEKADKGLVPFGFKKEYGSTSEVFEMKEDSLFSESILEECIKIKRMMS